MLLPTYKSVISGISIQFTIDTFTNPLMSLSISFASFLSPFQEGKMKRFDLLALVKTFMAALTNEGFSKM